MDILVNVVNQKLRIATNLKTFASGSQNFVRFVFDLPPEWENLTVFAQFRQGELAYNQYLDDENCVYLPAEIMPGSCTMMLYGNNDPVIGTTNYITFIINDNYFVEDANSTNISSSLYDQLVTKVSNNEDRLTVLETDGVTAQVVESTVEREMARYLEEGKLAAMTIGDGTIGKEKLDTDVQTFIEETDTSIRNLQTRLSDYGAEIIDANYENDVLTFVYKDGFTEEFKIKAGLASVEFDEETRYLHFLNEDGEDLYDPVYISGGGSGSGSSATTIVKLVNLNGTTSMAVAVGQPVVLQFNFISTEDDVPTGNGTCQVSVNGSVKSTNSIEQGANSIDVSTYLSAGANSVRVKCMDIYGNYKTLVYSISIVDLYITSTFDATIAYTGEILFKYIPYGAIEKTVYVKVDGNEINSFVTTSSGRQITETIPSMSHGIHTIEVYADATMNGITMESNHLIYEVICTKSGDTTPMISSVYDVVTVQEGAQISIPYIVYDPTKLACDIILTIYTMESGSKVIYSEQSLTVDRNQQIWNTRRYPIGNVSFSIVYGDVSKTHTITVTESDIDIEPVTNDLELYLTSSGRSNNEAEPASWTYDGVSTTFENFNWKSNGWIVDDNGDTVLRLNGDATINIDFTPFSDDLRTYGKTLEIEFAIRDVNNRDAVVISCMDGGIGLEFTADTARLVSKQSSIFCNYTYEERLRVAFVVESKNEFRLLSVYLNGILSASKQYVTTDNFQQSTPQTISIGSPYCGVDIYTIRSYSTALSFTEANNNYIADMADVVKKQELYEDNNIYDEYGQLYYEAIKKRIPVMTIIGDLPQSKGDKKTVAIKYENFADSTYDFEDSDVSIDVQGTSSQWYVRKNYKLKCSEAHQHAAGQMATKVFCVKADYAESTGTHNTQNANLVETLYTEKTPAQEADERCRSTIYGFPIVIFHQATQYSDPEFIGKYNFNFDKGSENIFGFTSAYDVESWEFCNNTSDACNFLGEIPSDWKDDFEARYLANYVDRIEELQEKQDLANEGKGTITDAEKTELQQLRDAAIARFKIMHDWVVSTKDDVTKFKNEFETYFDLQFTLIYYVYTFVALMVDQRAKNMFLTYWGATGKWQPWFYDNDTCFGINNEGQLVFDYYHEDIDQVDSANVYNGQNSVLWNNFRIAFASEIQSTYQTLRSDGKLTCVRMIEFFVTNGSDKWSASIYNEDSEYKYISMLKTDGDATNLPQVRGSGESHLKYFIENRLNYCDSKWYASDYANDYVSLRIYTPSTYAGVEPNADITITPYSNMYAGVRYKANGTLQQKRVENNVPTTFEAPDETFNDTETAIYGASQISSLGDLAPLYCGSINVASASKLINLKVGDVTEGYSNTNLKSLSVGTNRLLKTIDIRNCPNLVDPLDLSNCPNIEEIYATGSGITSVELPNSGYLKIIKLPETITTLYLRNQLYITDFTMAGNTNLSELWIENCPAIDSIDLLENTPNLEYVRLVDVDWSFENSTYLRELYARNLKGIDENGEHVDNIQISGKCHITSLTGFEMGELNAMYPYMTITYDNLVSYVTFMDDTGTTILGTVEVLNGGDADDSTITQPSKASDAQYTYEFNGWSRTIGGSASDTALKSVTADRTVYAAYLKELRSYTVTFKNGSETLETQTIKYGYSATYSGNTDEIKKTEVTDPENYEFKGWNPSPTNITGNTTCYATFSYAGLISQTWEEISDISAAGTGENYFSVGDCKEVTLQGTIGTLAVDETLCVFILGFNHNSEYEGNGITFGCFRDTGGSEGKGICLVDSKYNSYDLSGTKYFNMQHWGYNNHGGWKGCDMRYDILGSTDTAPTGYGANAATGRTGYDASETCATSPVSNTLMSCLPTELRAVMKPMTKYTDNVAGASGNIESNIGTSIDYLPLIAEFEIFGTRSYANEYEKNYQKQYDYFVAGNSKLKYRHDTLSSANWWERSPAYSNTSNFCHVNSYGGAGTKSSPHSYGLAPVFLV